MKNSVLLFLAFLLVPFLSQGQVLGETTYNLVDGSILNSDGSDMTSAASADGSFKIEQGTGGTFKDHKSGHGGVFSNGNQFQMLVTAKASITFTVCVYSTDGTMLEFTDEEGTVLGSIQGESKVEGADGDTFTFDYEGASQWLTATIVTPEGTGSVYMHAVSVENIEVVDPVMGTTEYDLVDGSILNSDGSDMTSAASADGAFKIEQGTGGTFKDHKSGHGGVFSNGNQFKMMVAEKASITFTVCVYSTDGTMLQFTDEEGTVLGSIQGESKVEGADGDTFTFEYEGASQWLTATIVTPDGSGSVYMHAVTVENIVVVEPVMGTTEYDLVDGSILNGDGSDMTSAESADGAFKIQQGTGGTFKDHLSGHGGVFKNGNQFKMMVAEKAEITFEVCVYSVDGTMLEFADEEGTVLGSIEGESNGGSDGETRTFSYEGTSQWLTATIVTPEGTGSVYMHAVTVENIVVVEPVMGTTEYDLVDGSILNGDGSDMTSAESDDGAFKIQQGTGGTFKDHLSGHGGVFKNGNQFKMMVAEKAEITFEVCVYSVDGTMLEFADEEGTVLGSIEGESNGGSDGETRTFSYEGASQWLTATIVTPEGSGSVYMHAVSVTNEEPTPEPIYGETTYDLIDGSILPLGESGQTSVSSADGMFKIEQGSGSTFKDHGSGHGGVFTNGNEFKMFVADRAKVTFIVCQYSKDGTMLEFTDEEGTVLGSIEGESNGGTDAETRVFAYEGTSQWLTATLVTPDGTGSVYMHGVIVENYEPIVGLGGKTQVWDFGAQEFGTDTINMLTADSINAWYDASITPGSSSTDNRLPDFASGPLSWTGKPNSDRLRTTNEAVTRYDQNNSSDIYAGRIYANGTVSTGDNGLPTNRYFKLDLSEDDEITVVALSQNGTGLLTFVNEEDAAIQNDQVSTTGDAAEYDFIAKATGTYVIYDASDKGSYFRFYRKNASYVTVSGTMDEAAAPSIPDGYGVIFTNTATGKSYTAEVSEAAYSLDVPSGHTYVLALSDANGYVITSDQSVEITEATTLNISVEQISLYTLSGNLTGLGDKVANLALTFTPDPEADKSYVPEISIDADASTYSVVLEPNCEYTITAEGVNDFVLDAETITITGDQTADISFSAKPVFDIAITATGLDADQLAAMQFTFTNLNEEGYVYSFSDINSIQLRNGTYQIGVTGLDDYSIKLALTSNLVVDEAAASKDLAFDVVREWNFDDKDITGSSYYGLIFTGQVSNQKAKSHLTAKDGATIKVPVNVGDKMIVSYYYNADFSIDGGESIITTSGSTSKLEMVEYKYAGTENDSITITFGGSVSTSYLTNIKVVEVTAYVAELTVGVDKDYQTINEALEAIGTMERDSGDRVVVKIDPGNYEEMLVIDQPEITLENASTTPSLGLKDKGVNIDENAVRITGYYGLGYDYYSMTNQKWDADVLRVNKENGYPSYVNQSGTTNGSYWNATVVVTAEDFIAKNLIIENSFNQYISAKEADDILVEANGSKGARPTDYGNTSVQNKGFIERAAALGVKGADRMILNNCKLVGHQDVFFGDDARVVIYKGDMVGGTDYIFGGMTAVFYKTTLSMNTADDDDNNDVCYITAGQQDAGQRGYLMYETTISSAEPGMDNAATYRSKPGSFGRCWSGVNCEVIWYNTTIETTDNPSFTGQSLIQEQGWTNGLGGPSPRVGEYNTTELSGVDNSSKRVSGGDWGESTILTEPYLRDGVTEITTQNFTKGDDGWDPIQQLIDDDTTPVKRVESTLDANIYVSGDQVMITGLQNTTNIQVFDMQGRLVKTSVATEQTNFSMPAGCWIIKATDNTGSKVVKIAILK